ncbi:MAG: signal peptidase II [Actinomycetes bacterium]
MRELWPADRQGAVAGVPPRHPLHELQAARRTSLTLSGTGEPTAQRRSRFGVTIFVAALVVLVDQATKAIVVSTMADQPAVHVLGHWLQIAYVRNPGAAFGLGAGVTVVFSAVAVAVVVVILRVARRLASVWWAIALGGLLGGAVGNLLDRVFRSPGLMRGHVVDWIQVPNFPVFNLADSAIVVSAVLMVVLSMLGIGLDGSRSGHGHGAAGPGTP